MALVTKLFFSSSFDLDDEIMLIIAYWLMSAAYEKSIMNGNSAIS